MFKQYPRRGRKLSIILIMPTLIALSHPVYSDEPLRSALQLHIDQIQKVKDIQTQSRRAYVIKRQQYDRDKRSLGRAEREDDLLQIEALNISIAVLLRQMRELRDAEDEAIRALLRPEQIAAYDAWLAHRDALFGSSRNPDPASENHR